MEMKILIVDDEPGIREVLKDYIESEFEDVLVDEAGNADEAILKFDSKMYHFVLLDIVMPGMNAFDFLEYIKGLNKLVQIIMITGNSTVDRVLKALEYGADDYLMKPFEFETLHEIMHSYMKRISRWKETFKNSI
jgi:DNA-binding response OmpR family regulator